MVIKTNETELAIKLGEAFRQYGSMLAEGNIGVFRKLLTSDNVEVTIYFNGNSINITAKKDEPKIEVFQNQEPLPGMITLENNDSQR